MGKGVNDKWRRAYLKKIRIEVHEKIMSIYPDCNSITVRGLSFDTHDDDANKIMEVEVRKSSVTSIGVVTITPLLAGYCKFSFKRLDSGFEEIVDWIVREHIQLRE